MITTIFRTHEIDEMNEINIRDQIPHNLLVPNLNKIVL